MKLIASNRCLVCGAASLEPLISITDVPMLCNRLCASEAEAANAPHGDISLRYCLDCGHIVNSAFDHGRVNYDGRYENTLTFRRATDNMRRRRPIGSLTATDLVANASSRSDAAAVYFLRVLCAAGNHGEGYDPSQPSSRCAAGRGSVEIIGRNFAVEDARGADFVCCRHVLEHLPEPMDLLRQLREIIAIRGDAVVFFEVPNGLFTLERLSIWDIIYEHVSYFMPSSLVRAFHRAGFTVSCAESAFDDQYLWLEARVNGQASPSGPPKRSPDVLYSSFSARFAERVAQWRQCIDELRSDRRHVVIWGAGAKGVMFLNLLRVTTGAGVDWVVDINPRKHGCRSWGNESSARTA